MKIMKKGRDEKRILLVFPHNFLELKAGEHKRIFELCKYFKNRNFKIDQLAFKNYESKWNEEDFLNNKFIENYFFYDFSLIDKEIKFRENSLISKLRKALFGKKIDKILDLTSKNFINFFKKIIENYHYDYIIVVYAYWAKLADFIKSKTIKKVILIEDFLAKQQEVYFGKENVDLKKMIKDEAKKINKFNIAIYIAEEEYKIFKDLAKKPKHYLIPFFMDLKEIKNKKINKKYDLGFIGFNNIHNINGINWFLKEVWPKISNYRLFILGNLIENKNVLKIKDKNILYKKYIKNLDDFYKNIKITICPLFSGTGLKVKIIESFSYGVPCVFTPESIIGFPAKKEIKDLEVKSEKEFINKIKILLKNSRYYNKIKMKIKKYFEKYFSKELNYKKLDEIFN